MVIHNVYDFLEAIDPQTFVGVDALTLTGKTPMGMMGLHGAVLGLKDKLETEDVKPFVYQGAKGFSQGPLRYADKKDYYGKKIWAIMMITGPLSYDALQWMDFDLRVTRVDLRVDVVMSRKTPNLAEKLFRICGKSGKLIDSLVGQTFYPEESREKTYYARIYDKSPEYGEDFGNVWRWELEIKRGAAQEIARTILDSHDVTGFIEDSVFGIMADKWGIPTPKPGTKPVINYVGGSIISPEQKLDWLNRTVAKTVRDLKRRGYSEELKELFQL